MKKIIAFAMSALLAVSAVALPVSAEPTVPFGNMELVGQAKPVSAEELAEVRGKALQADTDVQENASCIPAVTVTEASMTQAEAPVPRRVDAQIPAPVVAHVTATTIVLEKVEGYEYGARGGHRVYHRTSNIITNLDANTEYECYLTKPGDTSVQGQSVFITTKDRAPCSTVPKAPMVSERNATTIVLVRREGYEYRMNDGEWSDSYIFSDLEPDTEYTFYQRIAQTRGELASESSEPLRWKTAHQGPTLEGNVNLLLQHIADNPNSFVDEEGYKTLAYMVTDEYGTDYYFLMINRQYHVDFQVFSTSEAADTLLFATEFGVGHYDTCVQLDFAAALYTGNECVDYVEHYCDLYMDQYHIGDTLTIPTSGDYLSSADLSTLCTMTTQMLFGFWDEYLYNALGFGFRGLGFVVTDGYGDFVCHSLLEKHFGETVIENQWETECMLDGDIGDPYCTLCGQVITFRYGTPSRGYHVYDNNCDVDCNDCGEVRGVNHIYSFACDVECDICGLVRTDPLASHTFGADRICTKCGHEGYLIGDASGDGKVNMGDVAKVYAHTRGNSLLPDSSALAAADTNGDGKINLGDVSRILAHITGKKPLW